MNSTIFCIALTLFMISTLFTYNSNAHHYSINAYFILLYQYGNVINFIINFVIGIDKLYTMTVQLQMNLYWLLISFKKKVRRNNN